MDRIFRPIDVMRFKLPRTWWMVFIPSIVFYGALCVLFGLWLNYRADMRALEEKHLQEKQRLEEARSRQRYKTQLRRNQKVVSGYDDSVGKVSGLR